MIKKIVNDWIRIYKFSPILANGLADCRNNYKNKMSSKEKATELFYKFSSFNTYALDKECCKKSAIFLADEIIKDGVKWANLSTEQYDYWEEVKKEIQSI